MRVKFNPVRSQILALAVWVTRLGIIHFSVGAHYIPPNVKAEWTRLSSEAVGSEDPSQAARNSLMSLDRPKPVLDYLNMLDEICVNAEL